MISKEEQRFRHSTLSGILIAIAVVSAIVAGVMGFGLNLYMPTIICMAITFILMIYVGYFERQW